MVDGWTSIIELRNGKKMKGYIAAFKSRASADHQVIDYWFSDSPKDAMCWDVRELVKADVRQFNRGITIKAVEVRPSTFFVEGERRLHVSARQPE